MTVTADIQGRKQTIVVNASSLQLSIFLTYFPPISCYAVSVLQMLSNSSRCMLRCCW